MSQGLTIVAARSIMSNAQMRTSDLDALVALGHEAAAVENFDRRRENAANAARDAMGKARAKKTQPGAAKSFAEGAFAACPRRADVLLQCRLARTMRQ